MIVQLYNFLPKTLQKKIGQSSSLKWLRDLLLKSKGRFREGCVTIKRSYLNHNVEFKFYAAFKTAAKAKKKGIETTVLDNSLHLIEKYKENKKDCTILDIGANFGFLSLVWSQTIAKNNGNIISFEPNVNVYNSFSKSVKRNNLEKIITIENKAVGDSDRSIKLYMNNSTSNTLFLENDNSFRMIDMVAIDSYFENHDLKSCDLVKIDVDGIEYEILKGCQNLIKTFKPLFIVETNGNKKIIDFFLDNDYEIMDMKLKPYSIAKNIPLNIFCIPA